MKSGLEKLLNTGRDLVENPDQSDLSDPDTPSQPIVGDFSSHDLIHGNVADPPSFDEPNMQNPPPDDIIIVSPVNTVPRTESENVSRWSFSMNPLSFFQRSENPASGCVANEKELGNAGREIEQTVSVSSPQHTSTPNE